MAIDPALILAVQPTWADAGQTQTWSRKTIQLDNVTGLMKHTHRSILPRAEQVLRFVVEETDAELLRAWLEDTAQGQWQGWWQPTWRNDFNLATSIASTATSFTCLGSARSSRWDDANGRRAICAILPDYTILPAEATGMSATGFGTETVTLAAAFGTAVPANALVCWLMWGRLASDEVEFLWHTPSLMETEWPFIELPWEQPEVIDA